MWEPIAEELGLPWRAVERVYREILKWQPGILRKEEWILSYELFVNGNLRG